LFDEPLANITRRQSEVYQSLHEFAYNSGRALEAAQTEVTTAGALPVAVPVLDDTYFSHDDVTDAQRAYDTACVKTKQTEQLYVTTINEFNVCIDDAMQHLAQAVARLQDANELYKNVTSTMHAYENGVAVMRQTKARCEGVRNAYADQMRREQEQAQRKAEETQRKEQEAQRMAEEAQRRADQEEVQREKEQAHNIECQTRCTQPSPAGGSVSGVDAIAETLRAMAADHVNACLNEDHYTVDDIISSRPKVIPKAYVKCILKDMGMYVESGDKKNKTAINETSDGTRQTTATPECPVCFEPVTHVLVCGHFFCVECLADLKICPVCRAPCTATEARRAYF
jgi:hypothetical protein